MLESILALALLAPFGREHGKLPWFEGTFEQALERARAEEKLVLVDFWTGWCGWCKKLDRETLSDDAVVAEMRDLLALEVDAESAEGRKIAARFGVATYPTLIVLDPDGSPRDRISEFLPPEPFLREIRRIRRDEGTVNDLERRSSAAPDDVDLRFALATKLRQVGDVRGYDEHVAAIAKLDPGSRSYPMQRVLYERAIATVPEIWQRTQRIDVSAIEAFIARTRYAELEHEAWAYIADTRHREALQLAASSTPERLRELRALSRAAYRKAWDRCPIPALASFGSELARTFCAQPDLSADDKAYALSIARIAAAAAPEDPAVLDALAGALQANGDTSAALEQARRCIELDPENKAWRERLRSLGG